MASTMTDTKAWSGSETLLAWIEFRHKDSGGSPYTYPWAPVFLADASSYFSGPKEARIVELRNVTFGLSDRFGQPVITSFGVTLSDLPWSTTAMEPDSNGSMTLRGFLGDSDTLGVLDVEVVARFITDTDRRASQTPAITFRGRVTSYEGLSDYLFSIECEASDNDVVITPPVINSTDFASASDLVMGRYVPYIYGEIADASFGAVPAIYVGKFFGNAWHGFLVAANACKAVTGIFKSFSGGYGIPLTIDDVSWTAPGSAGFNGIVGNDYGVDGASGQRYCMIFGLVGDVDANQAAAGASALTVNVQGVETVGDASGSLITSIYQQIKHVKVNFEFTSPAYAGGNWAGSIPQWADGTPKLDDTSYTDAETAAATPMPSGNDGAFMIYQPIAVRDLVAQLCVSGGCDQATSLAGQHQIFVGAPASPTVDLTESGHILKGSFRFKGSRPELENTGTARCTPRYVPDYTYTAMIAAKNIELSFTNQVSDNVSASVTRHGTKMAQTVDLIARRDTTQAAELLAWRLSQTAEPRTVTFDVPAHLVLSVGLAHGQMVTATHRQGAAANGWIEKELYVRGGSLDQQNMVLSLICDDLEAGSP